MLPQTPPFLPPTLTSLPTSHWPGSDPDEASHAGLKAESILRLIPCGCGHTPGSADLFAGRISVNTPLASWFQGLQSQTSLDTSALQAPPS